MQELVEKLDRIVVDATPQPSQLVINLVVVVSVSFLLNKFQNLILYFFLIISPVFLKKLNRSFSYHVLNIILKSFLV